MVMCLGGGISSGELFLHHFSVVFIIIAIHYIILMFVELLILFLNTAYEEFYSDSPSGHYG